MSSILGTNVGAAIVPYDTNDNYASHRAFYGEGGFRSVADNTARNAIKSSRLQQGMLVYTDSNDTVWKLKAGFSTPTVDGDWEVFSSGGGGSDAFYDTFPATGTAVGAFDGTDMVPFTADPNNGGILVMGADQEGAPWATHKVLVIGAVDLGGNCQPAIFDPSQGIRTATMADYSLSTFGAAFPTTGRAMGAYDGTNLAPINIDPNSVAGGGGGLLVGELNNFPFSGRTQAVGMVDNSNNLRVLAGDGTSLFVKGGDIVGDPTPFRIMEVGGENGSGNLTPLTLVGNELKVTGGQALGGSYPGIALDIAARDTGGLLQPFLVDNLDNLFVTPGNVTGDPMPTGIMPAGGSLAGVLQPLELKSVGGDNALKVTVVETVALPTAVQTRYVYDGATQATPAVYFGDLTDAATTTIITNPGGGKIIKILQVFAGANDIATTLQFISRGGGDTPISCTFPNGAGGGEVLPFSAIGWIDSLEDEDVGVITGNGSDTAITLKYIIVDA